MATTTRLAFGSSLLLLSGVALAQEPDRARRVRAVPKDAGVYHLATRSWTRNGTEALTGSANRVIYNNTAPSGFYGVTDRPELNMTDDGRIPGILGHSNAQANAYAVDGFQIGYCDSGVPGPLNLGIEFYALYEACSHPRNNTTRILSATMTVPGLAAAATTSCWVITFDLTGTTREFLIPADGDGVFDGTTSLDNFGWQLHLDDNQATTLSYGPLLCYDPDGHWGCAAAEGDGTYYQTGSCSSPYGFGNFGSGLDLTDKHYGWTPGGKGGGYANGCRWFGGYGTNGVASGFWMVVYGENAPDIGTNYCTGNSNSAGPGGSMSVSGSGSVADADTVATARDVPNQPGIFFHGADQDASPFGCGWRCVSGGIRRGTVVLAAGQRASYVYDESVPWRSLAGLENTTRNFQYWFRDPMNAVSCGNTFNLTDGIAVPVTP